ncbi:hypothetical protein [Microbacterium laevaniformans]|uniref:hypothetical protein n=1 Tax=Microbacterium laevaniformans TaxID=36807 RepID=UPI00195832FC|nr:hypothetical protein [Microbacterium laevaniformans]
MAVSAPHVALVDFVLNDPDAEALFHQLHHVFAFGALGPVVEIENTDVPYPAVHARMRTQVGEEVLFRLDPTPRGARDDDANMLFAMLRVVAPRRRAVAFAARLLKAIRTPPLAIELRERLGLVTRAALFGST